jgi:hypothetical protein
MKHFLRLLKEVVVAQFKVPYQNVLKGLRKTA